MIPLSGMRKDHPITSSSRASGVGDTWIGCQLARVGSSVPIFADQSINDFRAGMSESIEFVFWDEPHLRFGLS
jgi:hypothetical protein